jgi:hypothetical protein
MFGSFAEELAAAKQLADDLDKALKENIGRHIRESSMSIAFVCSWCSDSAKSPGTALPDGWAMFERLPFADYCCPECVKNNLPEAFDE